MKKLFFTFFVATLSVVSAFASEYITLQSSDITWKHSIFSASDVSTKTYDDIKKGYNELSIDITKNSKITVGTFIINIYNINGEFVGRKEIDAGDIDKDDYTTFSLTSITGESIGKIDLYYKGSYTIKFRNLVVKKTKDKVYDYDCVIFENNKEYSYLADISVERYVIYNLPNNISSRTGKLSFAAKRQTYSVIEGEDMSVWVLLKGKDSYQKVSGWNGRDANLSTDYTNYTVLIPHNTISIKFTNGIWNGSLNRYVKDVKVFMDYEYVDTIIWNGTASSDWDNRDNWYKLSGEQLLCADILTEDLTVILPAPNSTNYIVPEGGITRYPVLPDLSTDKKFKNERESLWGGKQVNAGDNETATMVADKIYMESGAALVGVETLNKGTSRYREVEMEFTPKRYNEITKGYDWSLVGPVVKPWDDENPGQTRDVISRDYYLNDLPHVYMHEAKVSDDYEISWDESFPNLDVELPNNKAFAIRLPNQYGRNDKGKGLPAAVYNRRNETSYNPTDLITFHFKGRFYNEAELPKYTGLETGKPVLLNNTYPANINAYELQKGNGTIVYYDYDNKSFVPVGDNKDAVIMSQHGFIFTASNDGDLIVSQSCMQNTATGERSAEEEIQGLRLQIANEDKALASEIFVRYDFLKEDNVDYDFDSPKVFNKMEPELPDIYAIRYNSKWAGLTVPTLEKQIPLGIKVSASNQVFTISLKNSNLPYDILLEDRSTGDVYNLSEGEKCVVEGLGIDDYEGRFYLGTSESDISTDIEEKVEESAAIDVFTRGKTIVVSADAGVELDYVELVDMSGSKEIYELEGGHYEEIPAIVPAGIYVVKVVADKTSVVTKVKLN